MKIGIFGSSVANDQRITKKAIAIGECLASKRYIVMTGGITGYPHEVALAAIAAGGRAIAYGAGRVKADHHRYYHTDLSGYTNIIFQKNYIGRKLTAIDLYMRSLQMVKALDKIIIIGGRVGTMFELTIASGLGKDVFVLKNSGGITNNTIKSFIKEGHKQKSKIVFFNTVGELAKLLK